MGMLSIKVIWHSGVKSIGCLKKCRKLKHQINEIQSERTGIFQKLGKAAWTGSVVEADAGATGQELQELQVALDSARAEEDRRVESLTEASKTLLEAEEKYREVILQASKPHREESVTLQTLARELGRIQNDVKRLERMIPVLNESKRTITEKISEARNSEENTDSLARLQSDLQQRERDLEETQTSLSEKQKSAGDIQPKVEKQRERVEHLKQELSAVQSESHSALQKLSEAKDSADFSLRNARRETSASEKRFDPLYLQLGEELNNMRIENSDLTEFYTSLDDQLSQLKDLHQQLGETEAEMEYINPTAVRWFWGLAVSAGFVIVLLITVMLVVVR